MKYMKSPAGPYQSPFQEVHELQDPPSSYQQSAPLYQETPQTDQEEKGWRIWDWLWEFTACIVALLTLGAIIAVLHTYDGKTQPDWPAGINLNAIIALLTTLMKAAMATYIAEALSQLKWSRFRGEAKLSEFAALDAASRGAWGSAQLLFGGAPRHLASLGAFVLVFAAVIGAFTQQVINIRSRGITQKGVASIKVCNTSMYGDWGEGQGPGQNLVPLETTGAIYNGLMQTTLNTQPSVTCPTGNCTFSSYQSLSFCSKCVDLTSDLVVATSNDKTYTYNYTLPNGEFFNTTASIPLTIKAVTGVDFIRLDSAGLPLILNFSAITSSGKTMPPKPSAIECALYFCISTHRAKVDQGDLTEELFPTEIKSNFTASNFTRSSVITPQPCLTDGDCNYNLHWLSILAMRNTLSPLIEGYGSLPVVNRPFFTSDTLRALYGGSGNFSQINSTFASIATALTINARNRVCQGTVRGDAWSNESYIHVRWLWMLLPIFLVVLSLVFLTVTVVHTRHQYIWKSSPLALLCSDLQIDGSVEPLKAGKIDPSQKRLDKVAKVSRVRLEAGPWGSLLHGYVAR